MSIATDHLDIAAANVAAAAKSVSVVIIDRCDGFKDLSNVKLTRLRKLLNYLMKIRDELEGRNDA